MAGEQKLEQEVKELTAKVDQILKLLQQKRHEGGGADDDTSTGGPSGGGGQFGGTPTSRR